jgi:hypothetical protein
MSRYDWRFFGKTDAGGASPPGYFGAPFSPGVQAGPFPDSKLIRTGIYLQFTMGNVNPSVLISPFWMFVQTGLLMAEVQAAGDTTVTSPDDPFPSGSKINVALTTTGLSYAVASSQGVAVMQTDGFQWSKGEDRTPPGGGLQVRPSWLLNDGSNGIAVFGGSGRWNYYFAMRTLWFTP